MSELSDDYKQLLNERFDTITKLMNARFENVDDKLDQIHGEAIRTNSRVNKLEEYKEYTQHVIDTRPTECPNLYRFELLGDKIDEVETKFDSQIESLKKKLEDVFFFTKYPKLFLGGIAVSVVLLIWIVISNFPINIFG